MAVMNPTIDYSNRRAQFVGLVHHSRMGIALQKAKLALSRVVRQSRWRPRSPTEHEISQSLLYRSASKLLGVAVFVSTPVFR